MSSEQILYSFKELMYYGHTDKPYLVLITGSSLTDQKIVNAEKFAMKNQNVLRLVELNQSLVPHIKEEIDKCCVDPNLRIPLEVGVGMLIIPQEPSELYVKGNNNVKEIAELVMKEKSGFSLKHIYNNIFKGIRKIDPLPFYLKTVEKAIDKDDNPQLLEMAKEAENTLTNRDGFRNQIFETLETQIDQNFGWSLDLALAFYDYRVIQDEAGDLLRALMCYMILYQY